MSASMMPTSWPRSRQRERQVDRSDDLPTPPLPEATAITRVRRSTERPFARGLLAARPAACAGARAAPRPCARSARRRASPRHAAGVMANLAFEVLLSGHPGTVRMISTRISPPLIATSPTIPSSTMSRRSSGSITPLMASRIASWVGALTAASIGAGTTRPAAGRRARRAASGRRRRLLRHRLTRRGDGLDLCDRGRAQEQRDRRALRLRGDEVGRVAGAAPVADAVGDGDGARHRGRALDPGRARRRPRRRAARVASDAPGSASAAVAGSRRVAGFRRRPRRATGRTREASRGADGEGSLELLDAAVDLPHVPVGGRGARRGPRDRGLDAGHHPVRRERLEAGVVTVREVDRGEVVRLRARRGRHRRRGARCGRPSPSRSDDARRRSPAAARRAPRRSSRAPRRRRSARAGDRCRPRRARRAGAGSRDRLLDPPCDDVLRVVVDREDRRSFACTARMSARRPAFGPSSVRSWGRTAPEP